jgi:sugar/nucleoside kinase (ribokinase family)
LDALKAEKINTSLVIKDKDKMTAYSVLLLTTRGERTALVYRGASADFKVHDFHWRKMKSKWIYVSSLGGDMSVLRSIWKHAKEHQIKIAWDPGAGELAFGWKKLAPMLKSVDVLHVNQEEAAKLMGMNYQQDESCFDKLRVMVGGLTIVTGGTGGALAGTAKESWQSGTHPIKVISTTGAGDAFTSGFMAAYIRTSDIPYALQFGTANAESVILHISAKEGLLRTHTLAKPVTVTRR